MHRNKGRVKVVFAGFFEHPPRFAEKINMKKLLFSTLLLATAITAKAQCGITFSVASEPNLGPSSVVLTLNGTEDHEGFSVGIDWGDGSNWSIGFEQTWIHSYPENGTYNICVNFVAPTCMQTDYCNSYTLSQVPAGLCPLNVNYSMSGNTLTVNATGSQASDPELSFHPDILAYLDNPWDFSDFQVIDQHSGTFTYTYNPPSPEETYLFCVGYGDMNEPESCESNDYCSNVTFGNTTVGLEEPTDFVSTIQVFPVPAESFINVHFSNAEEATQSQWSIYGSDGKIAMSGVMNAQQQTILLPSAMPKGEYHLVLQSGTKTRKVPFIKL